MYLARFCYDFAPTDRDRALECIQREVDGASALGLNARLLVPFTRPPGGAAVEVEFELDSLDQLEQLRHQGVRQSERATGEWAHTLSDIISEPPHVQIYRVAAMAAATQTRTASAETSTSVPLAGHHARPGLTEPAATPGTGALPGAGQTTVEAGTG